MTKVLYQVTLLGLASSLLVTSAYANSDCEICDDEVEFVDSPHFSNIACGSNQRDISWTLENFGTTPVEFGPISIDIESDDSFSDNLTLVELNTPASGDCGYEGDPLAAGDTCLIQGTINPTSVDCDSPDDFISLPTTGVIDRLLEVVLYNDQREIDSPIEFDMTFTGSSEDFSLLGAAICSESDSINCDQYFSTADVGTYVYQDVGVYVLDGYLTTDINTAGDAIIYPNSPVALPVTYAFDDATAAYNNFIALELLSNEASALTPCNTLPVDYFQNDPQIITGGVYCFDNSDPMPVVVDETVTVYGSDPIVLIVDNIDATPYALQFLNGSSFKFDETTNASPENIYWVVNGNVQVNTCSTCPSTDQVEVAGTLLINGDFSVPSNSGPAIIQGRVLAIGDGDVTIGDYFTIQP
ncbi:MAG: hypothetical protein ABSF18_02075 [Gammaproteobacteria bacterium]|jgi:hypothetical protein